jgi:hypothetical protein
MFKEVAKNLQRSLNFSTLYPVCSQIWLNLILNDFHFGYMHVTKLKKVGYMDMDSLLIEFVNCDDFEGWITKRSESLVH